MSQELTPAQVRCICEAAVDFLGTPGIVPEVYDEHTMWLCLRLAVAAERLNMKEADARWKAYLAEEDNKLMSATLEDHERAHESILRYLRTNRGYVKTLNESHPDRDARARDERDLAVAERIVQKYEAALRAKPIVEDTEKKGEA